MTCSPHATVKWGPRRKDAVAYLLLEEPLLRLQRGQERVEGLKVRESLQLVVEVVLDAHVHDGWSGRTSATVGGVEELTAS